MRDEIKHQIDLATEVAAQLGISGHDVQARDLLDCMAVVGARLEYGPWATVAYMEVLVPGVTDRPGYLDEYLEEIGVAS